MSRSLPRRQPQDIRRRLRRTALVAVAVFTLAVSGLISLLTTNVGATILGVALAGAAGWLLLQRVVDEIAEELDMLGATAGSDVTDAPSSVMEQGHAGVTAARIAALRVQLAAALERERAARRLEEAAYREKTAFLTSISHELRTPLNAMLGFTDVLLSELDGPISESQREDLEHVRRSGRHLSSLVRDVIDLSAAASQHLALDCGHIDVLPILKSIHQDAAMLRQQQEVAAPVELDVPGELPPVWADRTRVQQIVDNLTTNALRYGGEGTIRIEAAEADGGVRIRVRDEGPGLSPERLARIFEEYERGPKDGRRDGVGLGLAIVRHLVRLQRGKLHAESELGRGTTFEVWLPSEPSERRETWTDRPPARTAWGTPG